jgi:hypothetical protein
MSYRLCWLLATRCTNFSHLFWNRILHASDRFSVHHQESSTVHTVLDPWWWTEELSGTCRVLIQNKTEKLVHLVGFILRIYHDARSSECQMREFSLWTWAVWTKQEFPLLLQSPIKHFLHLTYITQVREVQLSPYWCSNHSASPSIGTTVTLDVQQMLMRLACHFVCSFNNINYSWKHFKEVTQCSQYSD